MKRINATEGPATSGGYSQAMEIGRAKRTLFVSGQIPVDRDGYVPPDFSSQCRLVWANVLAQVSAAGMTVDDIAKVTTFLSDRKYADENGAIRRAVLGEHAPALTVVITGIFDEHWLLEIEAIAVEEE